MQDGPPLHDETVGAAAHTICVDYGLVGVNLAAPFTQRELSLVATLVDTFAVQCTATLAAREPPSLPATPQ